MPHAALPAREVLAAAEKAFEEVVEELKRPTKADGLKHQQQDRRTAIIRLATAALRGSQEATMVVTAEDFCLIHPHY
ncbi:MAG: hypothetical protein INR62_10335 [Rhodospirillales bacterium]|nr:hypothetical protein [Acetobacter sp.]